MQLWIISFIRPFSRAFVGVTTLDAAAAREVSVTFLPAHGALGTCLAFLGHGDGWWVVRASHMVFSYYDAWATHDGIEVVRKFVR